MSTRQMTFCCTVLMTALAMTLPALAADSSPWDLQSLSQTPEMKWIDETSPIRSLTYCGESFHGRSAEVFAFYATPGTIAGDPSLDKHLPAVVLVHGGGGTAFAEWVWQWAGRGYAAIAMDLSGRRPDAPKFDAGKLVSNLRVNRERLEFGGPEQGHAEKFDSVGGELEDDWPYHAVASVIRAHSLIRSFPEVDAARTAVTGISWGGYTTCLVASIDHRFKAAVPVYGCGFLYEGESGQKRQIDRLSPKQRAMWIKAYDPSSHLANCRVPILLVNGTNDRAYPLDSHSRSFSLVTSPKQIRIEVNMRHSHVAGWEPKEIGLFIDHHVLGTKPLPQLGTPTVEANGIVVSYQSSDALKSAVLHYTTDDGPLVSRQWMSRPGRITKDQIIIDNALPTDATIWMINATDQRNAMVSTGVVFNKTAQQ